MLNAQDQNAVCAVAPTHSLIIAMHIINASTSEQITKQLSQLLGFDVSQVQEAQGEGSFGAMCKVSVVDQSQVEHHYMLKRQDDDRAYCFYQRYLEPLDLNSPKECGYIELDGLRFLIMDHVSHVPQIFFGGGQMDI